MNSVTVHTVWYGRAKVAIVGLNLWPLANIEILGTYILSAAVFPCFTVYIFGAFLERNQKLAFNLSV